MNPWKQPPAWVLVGLCALAGVAVILSDDDSLRETAFTVLMYATLASSLNLCVGYMGYVNFGHIVFFGLGGYLGFYLVSRHDWPIYSAAPEAGIAVSLLADLLGHLFEASLPRLRTTLHERSSCFRGFGSGSSSVLAR